MDILTTEFHLHILQGYVKMIEEYRNKTVVGNPLECYYLFQLNHDAACTDVPDTEIDAWFITLIM